MVDDGWNEVATDDGPVLPVDAVRREALELAVRVMPAVCGVRLNGDVVALAREIEVYLRGGK